MKLIPFNPYATDYDYSHWRLHAESRGEVIEFGRSSGRAKRVGGDGNYGAGSGDPKPAALHQAEGLPASYFSQERERNFQQWAAGFSARHSLLLVLGWPALCGLDCLRLLERKIMSYSSDFTGGNADDRRAEADRILKIIEDDVERLAPNQQRFVEQMAEGGTVSGKQLLWLRDIKDSLI